MMVTDLRVDSWMCEIIVEIFFLRNSYTEFIFFRVDLLSLAMAQKILCSKVFCVKSLFSVEYSLVLERLARNESSEGLVLFSLTECLPPVRVLAADYVKNIAFLETYTWNTTFSVRSDHVVSIRKFVSLS